MNKNKIAVYGKGGIGKSTVSANLAAALAETGVRVLQIGCDPKRDSTRLLTGGRRITTVLDYTRVTGHAERRIEDVLFRGRLGVGCVEAGGPKPGVGCAGRGIISAFELLERFGAEADYDAVIYDVLGDVVCGGFAVPIRREYANMIYIVTSGEFMALYAANNILSGIRNYDGDKRRVAGLIFNRRGLEGEDGRVARFAAAVRLPVCAAIPRSGAFARCEAENKTLLEAGYAPAGIFRKLARAINAGVSLYEALPLTEEELEGAVLGLSAPPTAAGILAADAAETDKTRSPGRKDDPGGEMLSLNILNDDPLHGCAFNGAVTMGVHLTDAVVLAHSPRSCAYISYQTISSSGRRGLFERGLLLPNSVSPNLECSFMNENDMIFGGLDKLEAKVLELKKKKPKAIIVVSSCPSGIIGDDVSRVLRHADAGTPVIAVKTDGNLTGDYLQGMLNLYTALARGVIERNVEAIPDAVNIVFEKVVAKNTGANFSVIEGFLRRLGLKVNCRFLCETTFDRLRNFLAAPLNLLASNDYTGRLLQKFFTAEYGCVFLQDGFPVGFDETKTWLFRVADFFGRRAAAADLLREHEAGYRRRMEALRPALQGRKLMIVTYNHNVDWILKAAMDAGMEIVKLGILKFSQDAGFVTKLGTGLNVEENYDGNKREADMRQYGPDVLLTNYNSTDEPASVLTDTIPMCPDVGFYSGLNMVSRWAALLENNLRGEWMDDKRLFDKYYA
ncbi:MAG: AAA family ATPase [Gracilibacteraceae bacterium]|jgi:nitrogenase iron protein|nr:AAA family ATPase [Gracilibacteraceae bacterium]